MLLYSKNLKDYIICDAVKNIDFCKFLSLVMGVFYCVLFP